MILPLLLKTLYESTSEEDDNGEDDEGENKSGLLELEDLGPMMNTMKQAKVTSYPANIAAEACIAEWKFTMCCSRKYTYPSHGRFFKLNPHPSGNSILVSYFCSKNWAC